MRLYYNTVSTPLLSILRKLMSSEVFKDFRLVGGTAWALQRDPYSYAKEDIIKGLQQVDQVQESPMGIVSLKPLSYWELKVLDLKEEVRAVVESDNLGGLL